MLRFVVALLAVTSIGLAGAQTDPVGGNVVGLHGDGLQLELTTATCLAPFSVCLGHSTAAEPANEAAVRCTSECCSGVASSLRDSIDAQGLHTATGTCGSIIGFAQQGAQPSATTDTTQFLTVAKVAKTFLFGHYPTGTIFSVSVANQPANPTQACTVNNGFGALGQPNPTIVVDCEPIFKNGFE